MILVTIRVFGVILRFIGLCLKEIERDVIAQLQVL